MSHYKRVTWILMVCCLNTVAGQAIGQVTGFVGDDVLLSCIFTGEQLQQARLKIYWRDKDDNVVLNIIDSQPSMAFQSQIFRNRVVAFPDQFSEGNFSVVLQKVQLSDSGLYECHVPTVLFEAIVHLSVTGKPVAGTSSPGRQAGNAALTLVPPPLTLLSMLLFCKFN